MKTLLRPHNVLRRYQGPISVEPLTLSQSGCVCEELTNNKLAYTKERVRVEVVVVLVSQYSQTNTDESSTFTFTFTYNQNGFESVLETCMRPEATMP